MHSFAAVLAAAAPFLTFSTAQQTGPNSTFNPARPPAIPLAVRSPYLSTWQQAGSDGGNGGYLAGQYPSFWTGSVIGWTGIVRVDGVSYTWMGAPNVTNIVPTLVNQTDFTYTATKSTFSLEITDTVDMTVTFLSPVYPDDFATQSFPISFMDVAVQSKDGQPHSVQVYTDISAEWISGDRSAIAQWDFGFIGATPTSNDTSSSSSSSSATATPTTTSGPIARRGAVDAGLEPNDDIVELARRQAQASRSVYGTRTDFSIGDYGHHTHAFNGATSRYNAPPIPSTTAQSPQQSAFPSPVPSESGGFAYHKVFRQTQLAFSEVGDQTEYGYWYYVTDNTDGLTYQQGSDDSVRSNFLQEGYLNNSLDTNYRAINDSYPVFGFAYDFGNVTTCVSHLWAIALAQEDAVQFEGANGNQTIPSLWTETYDKDTDAVGAFFKDYDKAKSSSDALDDQIKTDSDANGGANYTLLTTLAVRQAFGGLEFTNTSENPLIFLKEISSDGNVNTVDVIFPFHPIAIYLNPDILKYLLDPLFINQENDHWPFQYSIHDIGSAFPNATGHDNGQDEMQPLEECGNMIIMTLAYAQRKNDTAYLTQHYDILRQWNEYLVNDSLIPQNQISTDDFAGPLANQTNLAIKGIIGIEAMAVIANLTGNFDDGANYTNIAHDYVAQWQMLSLAAGSNPPHTALNYGNDTTYNLLYNIYPDKELGLGLVPQEVFDQQSTFYPTIISQYNYGMPLDTRGNYTKNDWEIFCAAVASDDTKADFVDAIARFVNETPTNGPLTDLYYCESGDYPVVQGNAIFFTARPVVGGYFAPLALNSAPTSPVSILGPA